MPDLAGVLKQAGPPPEGELRGAHGPGQCSDLQFWHLRSLLPFPQYLSSRPALGQAEKMKLRRSLLQRFYRGALVEGPVGLLEEARGRASGST